MNTSRRQSVRTHVLLLGSHVPDAQLLVVDGSHLENSGDAGQAPLVLWSAGQLENMAHYKACVTPYLD